MGMVPCSLCGYENVQGTDRCEGCLISLMQVDLPEMSGKDKIEEAMFMTPVGSLLTGEDLLVCRKTDTLDRLLKIFAQKQKDCILVYEKKQLIGIISIRDIFMKAVGKYADMSKVTAEMVMTQNPDFVRAEAPLAYAVNKMAIGRYRHLPVLTEEETPLSIISILDVLAYLTNQ